ncbi:MAG: hypothetical protein QOI95_296 [Acidimicrobiaceae bacterium]|jgi:hypothetical protein
MYQTDVSSLAAEMKSLRRRVDALERIERDREWKALWRRYYLSQVPLAFAVAALARAAMWFGLIPK